MSGINFRESKRVNIFRVSVYRFKLVNFFLGSWYMVKKRIQIVPGFGLNFFHVTGFVFNTGYVFFQLTVFGLKSGFKLWD